MLMKIKLLELNADSESLDADENTRDLLQNVVVEVPYARRSDI